MQGSTQALSVHYDQLWRRAYQAFAQGEVEIDPFLSHREIDLRRGATLLIRPSAAIAERIRSWLAEIAEIEPDQHYYLPQELHITVLSLFTATSEPETCYARLDDYERAIAAALSRFPAFTVHFTGITASPGAVMVQGFPACDELNRLHDRLRDEFSRVGLGDGLDRRYRIATAHMTAMRFQRQPRSLPALVEHLQVDRGRDFGAFNVDAAHLVKNDWYMSNDKVELLRTYRL